MIWQWKLVNQRYQKDGQEKLEGTRAPLGRSAPQHIKAHVYYINATMSRDSESRSKPTSQKARHIHATKVFIF